MGGSLDPLKCPKNSVLVSILGIQVMKFEDSIYYSNEPKRSTSLTPSLYNFSNGSLGRSFIGRSPDYPGSNRDWYWAVYRSRST